MESIYQIKWRAKCQDKGSAVIGAATRVPVQVTDMMLQDQHYPDWGQTARRFWKKGNNRIVLFW